MVRLGEDRKILTFLIEDQRVEFTTLAQNINSRKKVRI